MAKLTGAPLTSTVIALRGTLDYACWRGIYYVRSWPQNKTKTRSPAVTLAAAEFAAIAREIVQTDPLLQAQWAALGMPNWTWRDLATAAIYGNAWEP